MLFYFGIKDAIDILLVAVFLYQIYKLMKSSGTLSIFGGIVSVFIIWILLSRVLEMKLMGAILDKVVDVGFLVIVVLFQDDIRRFLLALGSNRGWKFLAKLFSRRGDSSMEELKYITPVVLASVNLARKKTGALIVIQREIDLAPYVHTGELFTADVNARLIENIFFNKSPLHDGAMIISNNKIRAAGCILPVSYSADIPKSLGLRHRSGIGMSKETDALVIIISEERGTISIAHNGRISVPLSAEELQQILIGDRDVSDYLLGDQSLLT